MHPKHLLIIVINFCALSASAQIKKGTVFLGGNINFYSQNFEDGLVKNRNLGISPMIGKAIRQNLVGGIQIDYLNQKSTNYDTSQTIDQSFGASLFLRRYVELGKGFFLFGHLSARGFYTTLESEANYRNDEKGYAIDVSAYPGVSCQVNRKLHLEAGLASLFNLNYTNRKVTRPNESTYRNKSFSAGTSLSNGALLSVGIRFLLAPNNKL